MSEMTSPLITIRETNQHASGRRHIIHIKIDFFKCVR